MNDLAIDFRRQTGIRIKMEAEPHSRPNPAAESASPGLSRRMKPTCNDVIGSAVGAFSGVQTVARDGGGGVSDSRRESSRDGADLAKPNGAKGKREAPFDPFGLEALTVLWGGDLAARLDMAERTWRALASHGAGVTADRQSLRPVGLTELEFWGEVVNEDAASLPGADTSQAAVAA